MTRQASVMDEGSGEREMLPSAPMARFGNQYAYDLVEVTHDVARVEFGGRWAVLIPFSGESVFARFSSWEGTPRAGTVGTWSGVEFTGWTSSMDQGSYEQAVERTRTAISAGNVYQANICRVRSQAFDHSSDIMALDELLAAGNPAPHSGGLRIP